MRVSARSRSVLGFCFIATTSAALPACHDQPGGGDADLTSRSGALVSTLNVVLPTAVPISAAALGATDSLKLADRVQVLTPDGLGAPVSNVGPAETNIGMESVTGDLWSKGPVVLRGTNQTGFINVRGNLRTAATVLLQNHAAVELG